MLKEIVARLGQGFRTAAYPKVQPVLPERYRGRPLVSGPQCPPGCASCMNACPACALETRVGAVAIDLGKCLFCGSCADACEVGRIRFTPEYRMAATKRDDLWVRSGQGTQLASAVHDTARRLFGRSLRLRQVSAGGCNACESDINVLGTLAFDIGRFGIEFVASPRHADGLLITGPVTRNMALALEKTWNATPTPKIVVAVGACAITGGPYAGSPEVQDGVAQSVPVDLFVPGCPPNPYTVLDGLLRMLGRIVEDRAAVPLS